MGLKEIEMVHGTEENLTNLFRDLMKIFHTENQKWMIGTNSTFKKMPLDMRMMISKPKKLIKD